jgi:hypothetical protein
VTNADATHMHTRLAHQWAALTLPGWWPCTFPNRALRLQEDGYGVAVASANTNPDKIKKVLSKRVSSWMFDDTFFDSQVSLGGQLLCLVWR